jgi:hypothetical protein
MKKSVFTTVNGVTCIRLDATCVEIKAELETPAERKNEHGKGRDGCEWNPDTNQPSEYGDDHFESVQAEVMIGANVDFRICRQCAKLPRFKRYRVIRPIRGAK